MPKIFVIGCNKTATAALHHLFLRNGLKSQHSSRWDTDMYDCFSDNGNLHDVAALYEKYPDAIFILNTRKLGDWIKSRFKMGERNHKHTWAYPMEEKKIISWMQKRKAYYKKILSFFSDKRDKLILINIDNPGWDAYLCDVLNFNDRVTTKVNAIADIPHITAYVDKTLNSLGITSSEILFEGADVSGYKSYL